MYNNDIDNVIKAMNLEIPPAPPHATSDHVQKDMGRILTGQQRAERRFLKRMGVSSLDAINAHIEENDSQRRASDKPSAASRRRSAIIGQQHRANRAGLRTTIGRFVGIGGATPAVIVDRLGDTF